MRIDRKGGWVEGSGKWEEGEREKERERKRANSGRATEWSSWSRPGEERKGIRLHARNRNSGQKGLRVLLTQRDACPGGLLIGGEQALPQGLLNIRLRQQLLVS